MLKQSSVSDVTINSVTLESASFFGGAPYNLVPHIREINIYESLFSNALTANVTLDESINLPEKFPSRFRSKMCRSKISKKFQENSSSDAFSSYSNCMGGSIQCYARS